MQPEVSLRRSWAAPGPLPGTRPSQPHPAWLPGGGWYPRCFSLHPQPSQVVTTRGGHLQLLTLGLLGNCVVQKTSTTHADLQTAAQGTMDRLERGLTGAERTEQGGGEGAVGLHLPLARFPPRLPCWRLLRTYRVTLDRSFSVLGPQSLHPQAGVPVVLSPGQALESPGEFLENSDAWVPTWIHYIKISSCGVGSGGVEG